MSVIETLMVRLGLDSSDFHSGMSSASSKLQDFGGKMTATGAVLSAGVTLPLVGIGKAALDTAMDFESGMNIFQSVSGATAADMDRVAETARALGADMTLPATSAADAANAMTELAKAGLSVDDALSAAKGTLQLAAAAQVSETQAAEITANALNAFGLAGTEAVRIADLLAASANASSGEVTDMADALKMSSSVFASANIPIEDLVASIGLMANNGIMGSDAGTSLKQMLLSLQAPTDKAKELMQGLGIQIYDASGQMLPFRDIITQFSGTLSGMADEQRNAALATIFGSDAVRAANIVLMEGATAFDDMKKAVTRQGAAQDLAAAQTKGLRGAFEGLKSQVETLLMDTAGPFLKTLEGWTRGAADLLPKLGDLDPNLRNAGLAFLAVLAAAGPVLTIIGALTAAIGFIMSPIGLVIAGLALLAAAWAGNWGGIRDWVEANLFPMLSKLWEWLQENIPVAINALSQYWTNVLEPAIREVWGWVEANVFPIAQRLAGWLLENLPGAINFLVGVWDFFLERIKIIWGFMSDTFFPFLGSVANLLTQVVGVAVEALAGLWQNVLAPALENVWRWLSDNLGPALQTVGDWLNMHVVPAFGSLADGIRVVTDWINGLAQGLGNLTLPDWLTPGSPTPFEIGLWGVTDALKAVERQGLPSFNGAFGGLQMPALAASVPGAGGIEGGAGVAVVINHSPTLSLADEYDAEQKLSVLLEMAVQKIMQRLGA